MRIAVIGVGHWGPNLVRKFVKHKAVERVYCHDVDKEKLVRINQEFPQVQKISSYEEILCDPKIDAIVIATPVASHFSIAKQALEHDKHVLIEKPLTSNLNDAKILVELATKKSLKLMVDHISLYNDAVRKIKEIVDAGAIGKIIYLDAIRINFGLLQPDVNVAWDLAIHELSIIEYLLGKQPRAVSAFGLAHHTHLEDMAYINLFFDDDCVAHIHVSWLAPTKKRRLLIGGSKKTIEFDDLVQEKKIKVYDCCIEVLIDQISAIKTVQYQKGGYDTPQYDGNEPLAMVVDEFINSILKNCQPLTDGLAGLKIVRQLEMIDKSMRNSGVLVEVGLNGS